MSPILRILLSTILLCQLIVPPLSLQAKDIFIAVEASGTQNGTKENPYVDFSLALAEVKPGDNILIRGGTYSLNSPLRITINGSAGLPVTISGYNNEKVVFDFSKYVVPKGQEGVNGPPYPHDFGAITILNSKYVTVKNLSVVRSKCAGIQARGSSFVKIQNCITHDTYSSGVSAWDSDSILIEGNDVSLACNLGPHEAITVSRSKNFNVINNTV
ncbi:MAG TPA: right-handed parallel beta-helix repeat-containing protein, partial [Cytophagaceae bacterium]